MEKHRQMLRLVCRIMKITIYQLLLTFLFAGASFARTADAQNTLARKISIQAENQGLRNVLSQIQRLADVRFTYSSALISPRQKVTITAYQQPLSNVLDQLFQDAGIRYKLEGKQIILRSRPLNDSSEENNINNTIEVLTDRNIRGTVSDEKGASLPGVSILVKGTQGGTITDSDGRFDIDVPDGSAVLVFSFVGYVSQEVVVGSRNRIDISLQVDEKSLEEVVVVGYGEQSRTKLTSAISKLDKKVLEHAAIANVGSALQGTIPGLRAMSLT